jgi:tetratricopeptide (TPR) repeat protein
MNGTLASNRLWILNPWGDLALFVLPPLWILVLIWAVQTRVDIGSFGNTLLAVGGIGHHLPGFIRAYTDPLLFRRFRTRFLLAPLFLIGICVVFTFLDLQSLKLVLALWGMWHGAMQINGFLRIYDSKVGSISPATAWLDWAMCLVWFAGGLLHSDSRLLPIFTFFYDAGGPAVPPQIFILFRHAWDLCAVGVTVAFGINAWRQTRAGKAPNPVKYLLMAASIGFWWYAMVHLDNLLIALVLFEIFHDVQYNALVWVYNRRRVSQKLTASSVETFLFQPAFARFAVYALLVLAYGAVGSVTDYAKLQNPTLSAAIGSGHFWTSLFMASALLHFYFDGFIWRVREGDFRQGLGMATGTTKASTASDRPRFLGWFPGWKWSLFVIPVIALGFSEHKGKGMELRDQYDNLAQLIPENWYVNFLLGAMEKSDGESARAIEHVGKSVARNPNFKETQVLLSDLQLHAGNPEQALEHYLKAAALDSNDFRIENHIITLLLSLNRESDAIPHLRSMVRHAPNDTNSVFLLGATLLRSNQVAEAIPYLHRTVDLDPRHIRALNYLGIAAQLSGNIPDAADYFQRALLIDSGFGEARENLARLENLLPRK